MTRPHPMSQCSRVLDVLQDGGPRTIQEIHARAGTMRLNSRIAELRKRGHTIVCRTAKVDGRQTWTYELLPRLKEAPQQEDRGDGERGASSSEPGVVPAVPTAAMSGSSASLEEASESYGGVVTGASSSEGTDTLNLPVDASVGAAATVGEPSLHSLSDRLRTRIVVQPDGCWHWTGADNGKGYGRVYYGQHVHEYAHRAVYRALREEIPSHLVCDHLCRTPLCVNPAHIELVTPAENVRRGRELIPETTHCQRGHPWTPESTILKTDGKKQCRICKNKNDLSRYYRLQAQKRSTRAGAEPPGLREPDPCPAASPLGSASPPVPSAPVSSQLSFLVRAFDDEARERLVA